MKKYIKLFSVLLLTAALSACGGNAENVPETETEAAETFAETERTDSTDNDGEDRETVKNGDYEYVPYPDHAVIVKYLGSGGAVTIPAEIDGVKVTVIEAMAFNECETLTEIVIPDGVEKIETWAFLYCTNLKKVTIPDSVSEIGLGAFQSCGGIEEVSLPSAISEEQIEMAFDSDTPWYEKNYSE